MKRFLTLAVLFLLLIGTMPVAHAQEIIPEVSTLSELQDAIAQAEEGTPLRSCRPSQSIFLLPSV